VVTFLVAVMGIVSVVMFRGPSTMTVSAQFPEAPGLYVGNHVEVLGISVGAITGVHPGPDYVTVTMSVRSSLRLPADVGAQLVAPEVVSDRFVQLSPPYAGGPTAKAGTVIPPSRTVVPLSVDQVLSTLDQLVVALGPNGANNNGALSQLLSQLATTLGGEGPNIKGTVSGLGQTLSGLGQSAPQLAQLLDNLGTFSKAAAADDASYQQFANALAAVSSELAGDDSDIATALHNLQLALGQLTTFLETNGANLGAAAGSLGRFATELASEQQQLSQLLTDGPLALQNVSAAVDTSAPGGPALRGRYDPTSGTTALEQSVCGNALLRLLIVTTGQSHPVPGDVACGFASAIDSLGSVPGATASDLTLAGLAGGGS
jgi:phospholipid/cholesterol/gamma-HCH transport system substrate-binding protein